MYWVSRNRAKRSKGSGKSGRFRFIAILTNESIPRSSESAPSTVQFLGFIYRPFKREKAHGCSLQPWALTETRKVLSKTKQGVAPNAPSLPDRNPGRFGRSARATGQLN